MLKQIVSLTAGVLLALVIATCGGDDEKQSSADTQPTTEASVETITVRETEFELDPASPRIEQTGLVDFRVENKGGAVHALEIEGPKGESKTDDIQPGESATLRADLSESGTFEWYCPVGNHRDLGMEGEITVGGGSSQTGTTTTDTTDTTDTTETNTTTTNETTTTTETTPTEPGDDSGGSGTGGSGSGGSGSGGSGTGGSGY